MSAPSGVRGGELRPTPSKASATEDLRTTSEHAAMAVLAVAGAVAAAEVITAVVEAITAGDMRLSVHFGRLPFAILTVLLLAMPSAGPRVNSSCKRRFPPLRRGCRLSWKPSS